MTRPAFRDTLFAINNPGKPRPMIDFGPPEFWETVAYVAVFAFYIRVVWSWRK